MHHLQALAILSAMKTATLLQLIMNLFSP